MCSGGIPGLTCAITHAVNNLPTVVRVPHPDRLGTRPALTPAETKADSLKHEFRLQPVLATRFCTQPPLARSCRPHNLIKAAVRSTVTSVSPLVGSPIEHPSSLLHSTPTCCVQWQCRVKTPTSQADVTKFSLSFRPHSLHASSSSL